MARLELTPLIDVVFLLLTFFIYTLTMASPTLSAPVELSPLTAGEARDPVEPTVMMVDRSGTVHVGDRRLDDPAELGAALAELGRSEEPPMIYLMMQAPAEEGASGEDRASEKRVIDRGPLLLDLVARLHAAGLSRIVFVGGAPEAAGEGAGPGDGS